MISFFGNGKIPDTFDWRSKGVVTSVKNQGNCKNSWAFAAVAAMEANIAIKTKQKLDLSEQFIISCGGVKCNEDRIDRVAVFLRDTGTVDEACLPFNGGTNFDCNKRCKDWPSRIRKISTWGWVGSSIDYIIQDIYNMGVLIAEFTVYTDFYYYRGGIYEHTWGAPEWKDAVGIVGYDVKNQYWICKNSKGTEWGENGYFRIKWNTVDMEKYVIWIKI